MANGLAEVVEAAGDEHHPIRKSRFGVSEAVLDNPYPLHSCQNVLRYDADLAHEPVVFPLLLGALLTGLLLDWLKNDHFCGRKGLEPTILMQLAVRGEVIVDALCQGLVVNRTGRRRAQEAHFSLTEVADDHVFIRVRFFLPLNCSRCTSSCEGRWVGRSVPSITKL